jgi:hypothetical protein
LWEMVLTRLHCPAARSGIRAEPLENLVII